MLEAFLEINDRIAGLVPEDFAPFDVPVEGATWRFTGISGTPGPDRLLVVNLDATVTPTAAPALPIEVQVHVDQVSSPDALQARISLGGQIHYHWGHHYDAGTWIAVSASPDPLALPHAVAGQGTFATFLDLVPRAVVNADLFWRIAEGMQVSDRMG